MKLSSSLLAVLTCISLVCHVSRSLKFQTRDDASNGGAQKLHIVTYLSSEDAKREETNGGDKPTVTCYEHHIGCFQDGNVLTLGGALPRSPDCVAVITNLHTSSRESKELKYADESSVESINRLRTMKGLKILFHGFNQGRESPWIKDATIAFTNLGYFVLVVDWSKGQSLVKPERSAHDTPMVGRVASAILRLLITKYPTLFHPSLVHAIGFSMGAHAAGFFCRHVYAMTGLKIARLTGLDPASIFFVRKVGIMNKEDADFVDVIHTSIGDSWWRGKVGYKEPLGHVDFYPNGGSTQPGCKWTCP